MNTFYHRMLTTLGCLFILLVLSLGSAGAQLVTNGGFESSNPGVIDSTGIKG